MGALFSCCFGGENTVGTGTSYTNNTTGGQGPGHTLGGGGGSGGGRETYQTFPAERPGQGPTQPEPEEKRRQLAEAAEKRRQAQEQRGVKDLEAVRRGQKRSEELERLEREAIMKGDTSGGLKWQVS